MAKQMIRTWLLSGIGALALSWQAIAVGAESLPTCLGGLDPVGLARGERQQGRGEWFVDQGRFRYLFATEEQWAAFVKEPERYAVQYAGACAKMGPLSGLGSPERFAVQEGRIYLFASESCLAAFQAAPASYVERDDLPLEATEQSLARGRKLVALALRGFGGVASVDGVKSFLVETKRPYRDGDQTREASTSWIAEFPDRFARRDAWHGADTAMVVAGDRGWYRGTKEVEPYQEMERRFLRREFRRLPLVLLKARHEEGFRAVAAGRGRVGERPVDWLAIHLDGVTHTLGVDSDSGRVLSIAYRGRLTGPIVSVVKTFEDFREVQGVVLPHAFRASVAEEQPGSMTAFSRVAINGVVEAGLFDR